MAVELVGLQTRRNARKACVSGQRVSGHRVDDSLLVDRHPADSDLSLPAAQQATEETCDSELTHAIKTLPDCQMIRARGHRILDDHAKSGDSSANLIRPFKRNSNEVAHLFPRLMNVRRIIDNQSLPILNLAE